MGKVHVVGFGEDHVYALTVSRKEVRIESLADKAHRRLVPQAAAYLERPGTGPKPTKVRAPEESPHGQIHGHVAHTRPSELGRNP